MLVKAVLGAGMFPNLVTVRNGKREAKWHTLQVLVVFGCP